MFFILQTFFEFKGIFEICDHSLIHEHFLHFLNVFIVHEDFSKFTNNLFIDIEFQTERMSHPWEMDFHGSENRVLRELQVICFRPLKQQHAFMKGRAGAST